MRWERIKIPSPNRQGMLLWILRGFIPGISTAMEGAVTHQRCVPNTDPTFGAVMGHSISEIGIPGIVTVAPALNHRRLLSFKMLKHGHELLDLLGELLDCVLLNKVGFLHV